MTGRRKGMPTDKTWTMNCILAGTKAAKMIEEGREAVAHNCLMDLTPEFTPEDVEYLLNRIKSGS